MAIKETGLVWLVDYSDLKNLSMTQIETERFLHDGGFDATKRYLLIAANMRDQMAVIDLKEKKFVTKFETGVKPHPGRGANWNDPEYGPVSATTHIGEGLISVYGSDPAGHPEHAWKVVREEETGGPGLFLKTHPKSNHIWTDATLSKEEGENQQICVFKKDDFDAGANCWQATDHGKIVHFEYNKAGVDDPQNDEKCLKCHVTAHGVPEERLSRKFDKTLGVQCEACHGAGKDYRKKKIMVDRDLAASKGLVPQSEKVCVGCHNDESPAWKPDRYTRSDGSKVGFDYDEAVKAIAHPVPEGYDAMAEGEAD